MMGTEQSGTIDLARYSARVYTGRPNGERARKKFNVDEKDKSCEKILVIVPNDTKALNSSFFLGLLGHIIVETGSEEAFRSKYKFKMPPRFESKLDRAIKRALFNLKNNPALI